MSTQVLVLKCSLNGAESKSNALVDTFMEGYKNKKECTVTTRDLDAKSLSHLTKAEMGSWMVAEADRTPEQKELASISDTLIAELKVAEVVVIGVPMYNFHISSTFKAYIDRVVRAGVTFNYTATGSVGLMAPKKIYLLCARGGVYQGTENDNQTPWLKQIFGFIGQTDIEFVYAEGMATRNAESGLASAKEQIKEIVEKL
ncbi:FMN-dependent NADH-azoreductase [Diplonema papillatum]|nr:FMN-dependent NADH-azoreductase [Diplonema papillatum]KAJ9448306.1 FMN-dependent NADH-azoreductase [Diplonema papillatum]|eukprot:gene4004-6210_t